MSALPRRRGVAGVTVTSAQPGIRELGNSGIERLPNMIGRQNPGVIDGHAVDHGGGNFRIILRPRTPLGPRTLPFHGENRGLNPPWGRHFNTRQFGLRCERFISAGMISNVCLQ